MSKTCVKFWSSISKPKDTRCRNSQLAEEALEMDIRLFDLLLLDVAMGGMMVSAG